MEFFKAALAGAAMRPSPANDIIADARLIADAAMDEIERRGLPLQPPAPPLFEPLVKAREKQKARDEADSSFGVIGPDGNASSQSYRLDKPEMKGSQSS
jgi:hypothetical protein